MFDPFIAKLRAENTARDFRQQAGFDHRRNVAFDLRITDQHRVLKKPGPVDVQPTVGHGNRADLGGKGCGEIGSGQQIENGLQQHVLGGVNLQLGDQADQAVAAHRGGKYIRVFAARRGNM